ncbi:hypothetical protein [Pseudanabaena minima]|uniref:hypothetical protein n=1 Tax=Pseudanabaena minima TaxID=890415 RepID=UPI003DA8201A
MLFKLFHKKKVSHKQNPVICYRCNGMMLNSIYPLQQPIERFSSSLNPVNLPNKIVIEPNIYQVRDILFELNDIGLYRFYALNEINEQRLILSGNDVTSIVKVLAHIWDYGSQDINLDKRQIQQVILHRKIILPCSSLAFLCLDLLQMIHIKARVIAVLTMEEWNQLDDGHTLIEIFDPIEGWFIYDPSFKCIFRAKNQKLSLLQLIDIISNHQQYEIEFLTIKNTNVFRNASYDFSFWVEHRSNNEYELRKWYQRIFQIPLIYFSNMFYFTGDQRILDRAKQYMTYSGNYYNYIVFDDFMTLFYSK